MRMYSYYTKKYKVICYSGGYDSSYFVKQLACRNILYKYTIAHFVHNVRQGGVYEGSYIANMFLCFGVQCVLGFNSGNNMQYSKLRNMRYMFILHVCFINNVHDIYVCSNYNDFVENLIIRLHMNSDIYGLMHLCGYNSFYYCGMKINIHRPLKYMRRSYIEHNIVPMIHDVTNNSMQSLRGYLRNTYNTDKVNVFADNLMSLYRCISYEIINYVFSCNVYILRNINAFLNIKRLILMIASKNVVNNIDNGVIYDFIVNKKCVCVSDCTLMFHAELNIYTVRYNSIRVYSYHKYYLVYLNNIVCYKVSGYDIKHVYLSKTQHKKKQYVSYVDDYVCMHIVYLIICLTSKEYTVHLNVFNNNNVYNMMVNCSYIQCVKLM